MSYNKFNISSQIRVHLSQARMGVISAKVTVSNANSNLDYLLDDRLQLIAAKLVEKRENLIPTVLETRNAYKITGKEPSRYRPSAEALLRRVRMGKDLYRINNLVDVINILSMSSGFSIGGFDANMIKGDVTLAIGDDTAYEAIGRGDLNIAHMPGLRDDIGFFGTPTSDSKRTMVTSSTSNILLVYYDFFGNESLGEALNDATDLLKEHCSATDIIKRLI